MDENTQSKTVFGGQEKIKEEVKNSSLENQNQYDSLDDDSSSKLFKIIKIFFGLAFFSIFVFFVVRFVVPRFLSNSENKITTINYWGLWEDKNIIEKIISDFKRENPTINVEYSKQDINQYRERLLTRAENGTGPDIFRFHNTWLLQLSKYLLPLPSDVITKEEFNKSFYPVVQKDLVKNGVIYGAPLEIDTLSLFINSDLFNASGEVVPKTWDDFINTARSLTVKDDEGRIKTSGAAIGTFDNINHAPDLISLLFIQNGVDLENFSNNIDEVSDALTFYTSFAKDEGNVWDSTLDTSLNGFIKGEVAMYFGYSWDIFTIKALNPTLSFEVNPVPKLPGREQTIASYWAEGVSSKTKYPKEAFTFLRFLLKKETMQKLYTESSKTRLFGEPYSRIDLADTLKDNSLVYPFIKDASNAKSTFFVSDTRDNGLNSQMNNYLGNAVRSIHENTSPESAAETLSQGVNQVLSQYNENKQNK